MLLRSTSNLWLQYWEKQFILVMGSYLNDLSVVFARSSDKVDLSASRSRIEERCGKRASVTLFVCVCNKLASDAKLPGEAKLAGESRSEKAEV